MVSYTNTMGSVLDVVDVRVAALGGPFGWAHSHGKGMEGPNSSVRSTLTLMCVQVVSFPASGKP